jgi:hypothetical protein
VPFKNLAVSQDVRGWTRMHRVAMNYPWTTLVGGHLGRLGARADADIQRQYVTDHDRSARATVAGLDPPRSSRGASRVFTIDNAFAMLDRYGSASARSGPSASGP